MKEYIFSKINDIGKYLCAFKDKRNDIIEIIACLPRKKKRMKCIKRNVCLPSSKNLSWHRLLPVTDKCRMENISCGKEKHPSLN